MTLRELTSALPLDPGADEASDWVVQELSKQEYQQAQPTLWDRIVTGFWDWLSSLFSDVPGASIDPTGILVVAILVVLGVVIAILVGKPAAARRSAVSNDRRLFLDDDTRTAAELRQAAADAAARQDWATAVTERFRAIARDLGDRTLIAVRPGSTAHDVAKRATVPFPAEADALEQAARDFDDVRYLDRAGTLNAWERTSALDDRLVATRPERIGEFERMHA